MKINMASLNKANKKRPIQSSTEIQSPIGRALNWLLFFLLTLMILVPLAIVVIASFKTNREYMYSGAFDLPKSFLNFDNYKTVFSTGHLALAYGNTIFLIVVSAVISIVLNAAAAYAIARFDFKLKKLIFVLFFIPTLIPGVLTQVPSFVLMKDLGVLNTRMAGILCYIGADIMQLYMYVQFINKIPKALDESAYLDGASYFKIFRKIILPQLKPAIATMLIFKVIAVYNDMLAPSLYMSDPDLVVVSTALMRFSTNQNTQYNLMGAAIIAIMIPTLILYLFLQKYIFSGITDGAVKD